ncbi:LutC/YkgG family protein [Catenulispora rubra]|uniref:LutC/YkgG family protein n=1 Tax=Catenulispora rubra TaxID=280293 RepID=UPI00189231F2|nr:lactate utilization protein C [Catenulispora rubra]
MSSRGLILGRIQNALTRVPATGPNHIDDVERRCLREHGTRDLDELVDLLADNLADYRANFYHTAGAALPALIARLLADRGARQAVVPEGLPPEWTAAANAELVPDDASRTAAELDLVDSVVTASALAIAETGRIVLDGGPGQGRRRITLIPDHHICVVRVPDQVAASVPLALRRLDPGRPLTWISGPSATRDIEFERVEGVHGPRRLDVIPAMS